MINVHAYSTSDFYIAVCLCCLGFSIEHLDRTNPNRIVFCFRGNSEEIENAVKGYWDNTLKLSPAALFAQQKLLKSRLHSSL